MTDEQTNPQPDEPEDAAVETPQAEAPAGETEPDLPATVMQGGAEPGDDPLPDPLPREREESDDPLPGERENAVEPVPIDLVHVKRVLEAALLSSREPLTVQQLKRLFGGEVDADNLRKVLDELKDEWGERSIELTTVASGWRFRVKPEYQKFLDRITAEKPPRYSRAVLETLAIIAYRQPVTRGDIEDVRGVAVSPPTLKALEERGWIETIGHRETPGRPALFATTKKFLDDLNLRSLEELPALDELQAALEPPPSLVLEPAPLPDAQESLIDEAPTPESPESEDESQTHAG